MHGIGNDYVYLDAYTDPQLMSKKDLPALSRIMSDRHRGVGSDGLIVVCKPTERTADVRMRMFNADGTESEMCGNGVRCVAKFAYDRLGLRRSPMMVQTGRGILPIDYITEEGKLSIATVDMGEPIFSAEKIPVDLPRPAPGGRVVDFPIGKYIPGTDLADAGGSNWLTECGVDEKMTCVFVTVKGMNEASMRTWERGAGVTRACGTGACAALLAGAATGRMARRATIHLPGGDLDIRWDEKNSRVYMTGTATEVYAGEWPE